MENNDTDNLTEKKQSKDRRTITTNSDLDVYTKELEEDVKISNYNLREKSLMTSGLRVKWLNYLFKEQENLKRLKELRVIQMKKSTNVQQSALRMKSEDSIVKNDPIIQKIDARITLTKECISFLEYAMNIMNDFGFTIKNCIETFKLEKM